jgi:O-antigen/teichoic acid export membrane protein
VALGPMKPSQRVAKNVLLGGLGATISSLLQFGAVLVIARTLTVAQFGVYSLLIAFTTVLQQVGEAGIGSILIRDLATTPQNLARLFGAVLSLHWLTFFVVVLAMGAIVPLLHLTPVVTAATLLMGLSGLLCVRAILYGALLRSQEDSDLQAHGFLLYGIVQFSLILAVAKFRLGLVAVVGAYALANAVQGLFYYLVVVRRYERPTLHWNRALWKYLLINSLPIGAATSARSLGEQTDFLSLSWFTNIRTVGLYSGPYKIVIAFRFLPQPLVYALFPLYSRAAGISGSKQEFGEIYERTIRTMVLCAMPLTALFLCVPHVLVVGLLGRRYAESAPVMQWLGIVAMLFVVGTPFPAMLTALAEQRFLLISAAIAMVLRAIANVILVPLLGLYGPCCAVILSETALLGLWVSRLWALGFPLQVGKLLWLPALGSLIIGVILHYSHVQTLGWLALVGALCAILYLVLILSLGAFSEAELQTAREGMGFLQPLWEVSFRGSKREQ